MNKTSLLIVLLSILCLVGCSKKKENVCPEEENHKTCELVIQPYGDFSRTTAQSVSNDLKKFLEENTELRIANIVILDNKDLSGDLMNDQNTRYSADKILNSQKPIRSNPDQVVVGLTKKDISTPLRGIDDWGIQGLAYLGQNNCVVSTYRISKSVPLWKPVAHEFIHAYFNMHHCAEDNPNCLIQDGHGKPKWSKKNNLCESCKQQLKYK